MGLIGNIASLLAGTSRYVPPPPPPQPPTGPDNTRSTSAAPPVAEGTPAPAATTTAGPDAPTIVQPAQASPATAAQSVPRQGTPADTSPVRPDFSLAAQLPDEDQARASAIAAQARERLGNLIDGLSDAPEMSPALNAARRDAPDPSGGAHINATLPTLRGENAAGAALDKVA